MAKKPYVEQEECTGCGLCEDICPEVFQLNEDSVSEVHDPEWAPGVEVQEVVEMCPVECIHWEEE